MLSYVNNAVFIIDDLIVTAIVAAIITAVATTIDAIDKNFFSKKSMWAYSDFGTRRVIAKNYAIKALGEWILARMNAIKNHQPPYSGSEALAQFNRAMATFNDDMYVGEVVYQAMYSDGVFDDENLATKSYKNYSTFLSDTNYFLDIVRTERDIWCKVITDEFEKPYKNKRQTIRWFIACIGILSLILIVKK
jgi:hypothetical protein